MEKLLYVMLLERTKTYNKMTMEDVKKHVAHIKNLDESGKLELCGPLKGLPGVAGLIIIKAASFEEADELCKQEPLVNLGYAKYKLSTLEVANKENNYLL